MGNAVFTECELKAITWYVVATLLGLAIVLVCVVGITASDDVTTCEQNHSHDVCVSNLLR